MGDLPNLGLSVIGFYLEGQTVAIDLGHFSMGDDGLTDVRGCEVSHVNLKSRRSLALFHVHMNRFNRSSLYQADN